MTTGVPTNQDILDAVLTCCTGLTIQIDNHDDAILTCCTGLNVKLDNILNKEKCCFKFEIGNITINNLNMNCGVSGC